METLSVLQTTQVFSQILTTNFDSSLNYQLTVDVGRRLDVAARSYSIQLLAGSTVLGTYSSMAGDAGSWSTINLDVSGAAFAAAHGQSLQIILTSGATQTNFDNVRLTASSATAAIAENATNGTVVATLSGLDRDASNTLSYTLQDTANGRFEIDNITGQMTVADGSLLNFENNASHNRCRTCRRPERTDLRSHHDDRPDRRQRSPIAMADAAMAVEAGGVGNGTAGTNPTGMCSPMTPMLIMVIARP